MDDKIEEFGSNNAIYIEQISKLERKAEYLRNRDRNLLKGNAFLTEIFFESTLVDVRALMMENDSQNKNYTVQNSFKRNIDKNDTDNALFKIAEEIDSFLRTTNIVTLDKSIYEVVKFYTDKFVAHRDKISQQDVDIREKIRDYLLENNEWNLVSIIDTVLEYAKKCKSDLIIASLTALTSYENYCKESADEEDTSYNEINIKIYELLIRKEVKFIENILLLEAKGISLSEKDITSGWLKSMILEHLSNLTTQERMQFIIDIKK